ncbi:hypothetical protein G6514_009643 [Epicoccum nigrum]|nr:hypothetical protein G6514_009643 [Epicoccum nigrum]
MSSAATTATSTTPAQINPEQAVSFAALILADEGIEITADKLQILLKAAGITEVEPIWSKLFANALKDKDIWDILTAVAASGPRAGGETAAGSAGVDGSEGGEAGVVDDDGAMDDKDDSGDEGMFGLFD